MRNTEYIGLVKMLKTNFFIYSFLLDGNRHVSRVAVTKLYYSLHINNLRKLRHSNIFYSMFLYFTTQSKIFTEEIPLKNSK